MTRHTTKHPNPEPRNRYRIRRNSGTDRDRQPLYAANEASAQQFASHLAEGWGTTLLVEMWCDVNGWWDTISKHAPRKQVTE